MKLRFSRVLKIKELPFLLLVLLCSNKWILEGIIDVPLVELAVLLAGVFLLLLNRGWNITRSSLIWLPYCISLVISLGLKADSVNTWGRAGIMIAICLYAVAGTHEQLNFRKVSKLLLGIAAFHAVALMVQFLIKDQFNALYFPLLNETSRAAAQEYARKGYYFGVHNAPHEVAGVFVFAIVLLLMKMAARRRIDMGSLMMIITLFLPLLLTGKKAIIAAFVLIAFVCILILYATRKDMHRIVMLLILGIIAGMAVIVFALANPDNPFVFRFAKFFTGLINGNASDSGRGELYAYAFEAWKENPLLGIGWYQFTRRTTQVYGYAAAHHVNLDYLQWLAEMGIVGFVLNMIPVCVMLYRVVWLCRYRIRKMMDVRQKTELLFAVFVQLFILTYAFLEVPFYDLYFFAMYIMSAVIINGYYGRRHAWRNNAFEPAQGQGNSYYRVRNGKTL